MTQQSQISISTPMKEAWSADGSSVRFRSGASKSVLALAWIAFSGTFFLLGILGMLGILKSGWSSSVAPLMFAVVGGLFLLIGVTMLLFCADVTFNIKDRTYLLKEGLWPKIKTRTGTFADIAHVRSSIQPSNGSRTALTNIMLDWKTGAPSLCLKSFRHDPIGAEQYASKLCGIFHVSDSDPLPSLSAKPDFAAPPAGIQIDRSSGTERLILPPVGIRTAELMLLVPLVIGVVMLAMGLRLFIAFWKAGIAFRAFDGIFVLLAFAGAIKPLTQVARARANGKFPTVIEPTPTGMHVYIDSDKGKVEATNVFVMGALASSAFKGALPGLGMEQIAWINQWVTSHRQQIQGIAGSNQTPTAKDSNFRAKQVEVPGSVAGD